MLGLLSVGSSSSPDPALVGVSMGVQLTSTAALLLHGCMWKSALHGALGLQRDLLHHRPLLGRPGASAPHLEQLLPSSWWLQGFSHFMLTKSMETSMTCQTSNVYCRYSTGHCTRHIPLHVSFPFSTTWSQFLCMEPLPLVAFTQTFVCIVG